MALNIFSIDFTVSKLLRFYYESHPSLFRFEPENEIAYLKMKWFVCSYYTLLLQNNCMSGFRVYFYANIRRLD
jgi:hypothetical protein